MKVSVLIPTYNRRRYVVEAIESVIAQDFADMEIIVVDDGSTDGTAAALAQFGSVIRVIHTDNQGPALARNTGMMAARGEYVAWLDSDDLYYPFKIRLQSELLDRFPTVGVVYSEFSAFNDDGFWDECHLKKYHASAYLRGGIDYDRLFSERRPSWTLLSFDGTDASVPDKWRDSSVYSGEIYEAYLFNTVVFTNSIMFRRSQLERAGLQQKKFGMFHDLEFTQRLLKNTKAAFVDIPTYKLRYHPHQISTTQSPQGGGVAIRIQRDLLRVFRHHVRQDPAWHAINHERINTQMARLCRAVAIPMLSYDCGTTHESRYYPARARRYLAKCRECGRPETLLCAMTYSPEMIRRLVFKLMSMRDALSARHTGQ